MRFVIIAFVIVCASRRAHAIDRSCVHAVDGDLHERIDKLSTELPANDPRRRDYDKLRQERDRLGAQAAQAESDFERAVRAAEAAVRARNPGLSPDSAEFKRQSAYQQYSSADVDQTNARMLSIQVFGYNDTEGRQHRLLKTLPVPKAEYDDKVRQLMPPASRDTKDEALKQLLVVLEASTRAGAGRPIEDWMLSVPPELAATPMEDARGGAGVGFDVPGAISDANELRRLMAVFRGREEREALDVAHLPRYVPAPEVRREWVLQKSPRMPETKRQAAAVVGRLIADDTGVQRVRQIFRNAPPPPEITNARDPGSFKKGAGGYVKTVIEQLKPVIYVLDRN
jgi:hypothetical protein